MTQTQHTPGPWGCTHDPSIVDPLAKVTNGYIVAAGTDKRNSRTLAVFSECPNEANARLIAAAPQLLEAMVEFVRITGDPDWTYGHPISAPWKAARREAIAAIKAAKVQ